MLNFGLPKIKSVVRADTGEVLKFLRNHNATLMNAISAGTSTSGLIDWFLLVVTFYLLSLFYVADPAPILSPQRTPTGIALAEIFRN